MPLTVHIYSRLSAQLSSVHSKHFTYSGVKMNYWKIDQSRLHMNDVEVLVKQRKRISPRLYYTEVSTTALLKELQNNAKTLYPQRTKIFLPGCDYSVDFNDFEGFHKLFVSNCNRHLNQQFWVSLSC